ncbi:MAG: hypothetical protein KAI79_10020 [Bacteroidales bacterium]|nr:hypothetical protein [Bacteroidales bacterium]
MAIVYKGRNGALCIGRIGKDGIIYEKININSAIGRIDFPDNYVYDSIGNFLGRIDSDGNIYKSKTGKKKCIGRIDYNGFIYDSVEGNNVIAHVQRSDEMYGAAYFLLY